MAKKNYIECAKCHQNAETQPNRNEYTKTYPIRDKDGQIYCWDCYKSFSRCKGCQKSVANLKFPASGNPYYPHASGYSVNCERIENEVEFICSEECSENLRAEEYRVWKEKLNQDWTKCEECMKLVDWIKDITKGREGGKLWEAEKHYSRIITLVSPGEGKLCKRCKHQEEVEKPRQEEIRTQAQKYWDSLSYETRLKEVIRSRSVGWGEKFKDLTAEQIAAQSEVPRGIIYEFELKDCHHDCQDCHLDNDFRNSADNDNSLVSTNNNNKIEKLEKELIEAKSQGKSQEEIKKITVWTANFK